MTGAGPRRWHGQWVWCADAGILKTGEFMSDPRLNPKAFDRRVLFRKTVELAELPATAPLRITADSRYTLWVNGRELARGPVRGHPSRLRYDTVDTADALVPGVNAICVLVRFYGHPNAWWMPASPTFSHGGGVLLAELDLPTGVVGTDRSWRYLVSDAWQPQAPAGVGQFVPEVLDGRRLDHRWLAADYDDSRWRPARVVTAIHLGGTSRTVPPADPYGPLPPRPIPWPVSTLRPARRVSVRRAKPPNPALGPVRYVAEADAAASDVAELARFPLTVDLDAGSVAVLTADWGEIVTGTLVIEVDAPAGVRIDARSCEELDTTGRLPRHHHAHGVSYTTRGLADRFESGDPTGGRYAIVVLRGTGPVTVRRVAVVERLRPRPSGPYFLCSDEVLNEVYDVGLRTVRLTAQDAYVDCPTREQRAWTGDSVVHQSVDLVTNPDWSLARWHPRLAASPRPDGMLPMAVVCDFEHAGTTYIPDWSLHWIRSVHNLYRWTGDRDLVAGLMPVAENALRWFDRFAVGGLLSDVTGWVLLDWASVQGEGASAVLNGLWGRALRDFAEMARWLGDAGRAGWAQRQHAALAEAYQVFWCPDRGGYRDWLTGTAVQPRMSEHASAAAVVGGLVPADRRRAVLRLLTDRSDRVGRSWSFQILPLRAAMGPPPPDWDVDREVVAAQPFFRYVVHDAVAALGGADHMPRLCRDWKPLLEGGARTWRETWQGGSHCHGWSSTPSRDLPLYTLGLSPARPGFTVARVAPRLGDLAWARGAVPTPHGLLRVSVDRDGVEVDSPVPVELDLGGRTWSRPAGRWAWPRGEVVAR